MVVAMVSEPPFAIGLLREVLCRGSGLPAMIELIIPAVKSVEFRTRTLLLSRASSSFSKMSSYSRLFFLCAPSRPPEPHFAMLSS